MAAIAIILRKLDNEGYLRLMEEDIKVNLTYIGKDIWFKFDYIQTGVRPYYQRTRLFDKIDSLHMVHDCGNDIELFIYAFKNPFSIYNWQYDERGYKDPKIRKKAIDNDPFKKIHDELNNERKIKLEKSRLNRTKIKM